MPTASVCTEPFRVTAEAMARVYGFPGYRYALIPHPIANLTEAELRERAAAVAPRVLEILGVDQ